MNRMHVKRLERGSDRNHHARTLELVDVGGTDTDAEAQVRGKRVVRRTAEDLAVEPWETFWVVISSYNNLGARGNYEEWAGHLASLPSTEGLLVCRGWEDSDCLSHTALQLEFWVYLKLWASQPGVSPAAPVSLGNSFEVLKSH